MTSGEFAIAVRLDLDAIRSRYRRAVDSATPDQLFTSAADIPQLLSEVDRLGVLVLETRLQHANLRAAVRATLSAACDGEPDPFVYLSDELRGEWPTVRDDWSRR